MRHFISGFATTSLKFLVVGLYASWGLKIMLDPDVPNVLFNLLALSLSVFGAWVLAARASDWVERALGVDKATEGEG